MLTCPLTQVTRRIREEHSNCELPIIMITCSSLEEDVIKGLELGANDYMTKPLRCAAGAAVTGRGGQMIW